MDNLITHTRISQQTPGSGPEVTQQEVVLSSIHCTPRVFHIEIPDNVTAPPPNHSCPPLPSLLQQKLARRSKMGLLMAYFETHCDCLRKLHPPTIVCRFRRKYELESLDINMNTAISAPHISECRVVYCAGTQCRTTVQQYMLRLTPVPVRRPTTRTHPSAQKKTCD